MARKRKPADEPMMETPVLMLPAPRTTTHKREHEKDPYASPPGAVPGRASNERIVRVQPLGREPTTAEKAQQVALRQEMEAKGARYHQWLDALIKFSGDKIAAGALVMGMTEEAFAADQYNLEADIRQGQVVSEIGDVLMRNDLTTETQVLNIRRWLLSDNAAASINAQKLLQELAGDSHQEGSFEQLIRIHNAGKAMR